MTTAVFKYHFMLTTVKKFIRLFVLSGLLFCFVYDSIGIHYEEMAELTELVDSDVENDVEGEKDKDVILFSLFSPDPTLDLFNMSAAKQPLFGTLNFKSTPPTPPPDFS